jgi:hypothetical protein
MEIFKDSNLLNKLITSQSKRVALPLGGVQTQALTTADLESIYGTSEDFLGRYRNFEQRAFQMMQDSKNLAYGAEVPNVDLMQKMGKLDLSMFNYQAKNSLQEFFNINVLQIEALMSKAGIPGMEFPSGNLYSSLMKFDVSQVDNENHAAVAFFNRTFFNVNPNKEGALAFNFGVSNMFTSEALERTMRQQAPGFADEITGRILTFDVETTGVTKGSQVRSFAGRIADKSGGQVEEFAVAFENMQMNNVKVRTSRGSMLLSEGVNFIEGSRNVKSMGEGGAEFVAQSKTLFQRILSEDIQHLSGHNILFDLQKMSETLNSLDSFDDEAKNLMSSVFDRISGRGAYAGENNFLIDTRETLTGYFAKRAEEQGIQTSQKAMRLLAPESVAKISIGGSTTPSSIENIVANSNILQLIEEESRLSGSAGRDAQSLMRKIQSGSHIAETDVHMQATLQRHQLLGTLDFFDDSSPVSSFVKLGRKKYLSGAAILPTTNIADVAHLEKSGIDYLSGAGARHVSIEGISASELGITDRRMSGISGQLSYNKSAGGFQFQYENSAGAKQSINISDEATARNAIQSKLRSISTSNDNISINGFSYIDATKVDQAIIAKEAVRGVRNQADTDQFIRSLGLTDEQFGVTPSSSSIFGKLGTPIRGQSQKDLQSPLTFGDDVIKQYHKQAASAGLGFSSLNVQDRILGVKMAQATSSIGMGVSNALDASGASSRGFAHARKANLLSEMGLSFFHAQKETRLIGEIDDTGPTPASKIMANFESLFDFAETRTAPVVAGQSETVVRSLNVKAFGGADILNTDLNKFTLSYVNGTEGPSGVGARINVVWGANKTFSEDQSKLLAAHLLDSAKTQQEFLSTIDGYDLGNSLTKTELIAAGAKGTPEREKIVLSVAEQIREKGIVTGYAEGDVADALTEAFKKSNISLIENDVELLNHQMRLAHSQGGLLTFASPRNAAADEAAGITSSMIQSEINEVLESSNAAGEFFTENRSAEKRALQVIRDARGSSSVSEAIDTTRRAVSNLKTPMTDFYSKNKTKLGYGGIAIAALGAGYYMSKKHRESSLYDETVKSQPIEPGNPRRAMQRSQASLASPSSTRRDPLTTAGIVGNLDRNKIGHSQMGPNKYNHLYGG